MLPIADRSACVGSIPRLIQLRDSDGLREDMLRTRRRLVAHDRTKRDGAKLFKQLKEKFGPTWPVVEEFVGIVFFVGLRRGNVCSWRTCPRS